MALIVYYTFQVCCNQVAFLIHSAVRLLKKGLCFLLIHVASCRIARAWNFRHVHTDFKYDRSSMIFKVHMQVTPTRLYKSSKHAILHVPPQAQKRTQVQQT